MTLSTTEPVIPIEEGFAVRDAASANWVIRKIVEARTYSARVKAWAEAEQRRAQREESFLLHRFGLELEDWARRKIAQQHGKRQSVSLPAGCIGFRAEPMKLLILDERELLTWCRENLPSAIRTIESVPKTPLMEHINGTGECPAGTELTGGGQRFYITAKNLTLDKGERDAESEEEQAG